MPRTGVTKDQVAVAASAVCARGEAPTLANVRQELGDTGSISTIGPYLRAWKEERAEARVEPSGAPVPEPVRAQNELYLDKIWAAAQAVAEANLAPQREALLREKAETAAAIEEVMEAALEVETTLENTTQALQKAEAEQAATLQQLLEATRANGALQVQVESALKAQAKAQQEVLVLQQEVNRLRLKGVAAIKASRSPKQPS